MDLPAEFKRLDQNNPRAYRVFWNRASIIDAVLPPTDDVLAAAFVALEYFSNDVSGAAPSTGATGGACYVIARAIDERTSERDAIFGKLARYYWHPNCQTAAFAIRAVERVPSFSDLALPKLRELATAQQTTRSPIGVTMRSLAWIVHYKFDPTIESDLSLKAARAEAAFTLRLWQIGPPKLSADLAWIPRLAERLESASDIVRK